MENTNQKYIKVAIVDDEKGYRLLIKNIINKDKRMKFIAEYNSAESFIQSLKAKLNVPKICLIDYQLERMTGIDCIKEVSKNYPDIHFILMTAHPNPKLIAEVKDIGVDYIEKGTIIESLIDKIITISDDINDTQIFAIKKNKDHKLNYVDLIEYIEKSKSMIKELSPTQIKVIKLRIQGKSCEEIANILGIDKGTVRTHITRANKKLQLPDLLSYIFNENI